MEGAQLSLAPRIRPLLTMMAADCHSTTAVADCHSMMAVADCHSMMAADCKKAVPLLPLAAHSPSVQAAVV